jgi:hypothetical protein
MDNNPEKTEITVHVNMSDGGKTVTLVLGDLDNEQLESLYKDAGVEEARLVLRERTGRDPAVTLWNITPEDMKWRYDWMQRHKGDSETDV